MNICIFCSANDLEEKYTKPAKQLTKQLAEAGHTLVWGGSDCGLMKDIADGAQEGGGKVVGVCMELFRETARPNVNEMIMTNSLSERKAVLLERSDIIIMLVGGLGTLDEATEIIELKKQGSHNKPVIVLNSDGFYSGLQMQLQRMADEGFLPVKEQATIKVRPLSELVQFVETPEAIVDLINHRYST